MMYHGSKGCNTGTCTDKKKIFFHPLRQRKGSLRSPKGKFTADLYFFKKIFSTCSAFQQYNHQFKHGAFIGPGSDGITAPSPGRLFVDGKIQRYKLSGFKLKGFS